MLRFLSRQQRARNLLLIFVAFMMVVGLVILYTPIGRDLVSWAGATTNTDDSAVVAQVEDEKITLGEYRKALQRLTQGRFGREFNEAPFAEAGRTRVLEQLIEERLQLVEARRLKLWGTDEEVYKALLPMFRDASGKFIPKDRYFRAIEQSGQTVEEFEEGLRRSIIQDKVRTYITAALDVSPREIEDEYIRTNTSVKLVYAIIKPKDLLDRVTADETEARSYFNDHKEEFLIKEIERQVDYLRIPLDKMAVTVSEQELKEEYDKLKSDYTLGAWVSQIELPFTETNENDVRKKADDIVKRARGDDKTPAEDFSALGGKSIGYVKKDSKDTSYKQRVFTLFDSQKDVTEPIREEKDKKFYILKVTRWDRKPLSRVREDVMKKVRERKQRDAASALADDIKKRLDEIKDLRKVAEEFRAKLGNLPVDQLVRRTDFFATGEELPEFGDYSSSFTSSAASLDEIGQVSSKIYLSDGYALAQLVAKREPHPPQFEEVRTRVVRAVKLKKARDLARQQAERLIALSPTPAALKKNAAALKLEVKTQDEFKVGTWLPDLDSSKELEGLALTLEAQKVCPRPVTVGDAVVVFGVTERKQPDMTKLASERESIRDRLLSSKRDRFFRDYLEKLKKKLTDEGRIVIHQDVIDAYFNPGEKKKS